LSNIARGLAEIAAQQIVNGLMGAIGSGGGGVGGVIAGVFGSFAEGGRVAGPGTSTSDSVLARLSNGEYVINAKAVRFWGPDFFDRLNKLRRFNPEALLPRYAAGGPVGASVTAINNNLVGLDRRLESKDEVKVDVKAEVDKDRLIDIVVKSPRFSKAVQKDNYRNAKTLARSLG
jgi:hypothetical protein